MGQQASKAESIEERDTDDYGSGSTENGRDCERHFWGAEDPVTLRLRGLIVCGKSSFINSLARQLFTEQESKDPVTLRLRGLIVCGKSSFINSLVRQLFTKQENEGGAYKILVNHKETILHIKRMSNEGSEICTSNMLKDDTKFSSVIFRTLPDMFHVGKLCPNAGSLLEELVLFVDTCQKEIRRSALYKTCLHFEKKLSGEAMHLVCYQSELFEKFLEEKYVMDIMVNFSASSSYKNDQDRKCQPEHYIIFVCSLLSTIVHSNIKACKMVATLIVMGPYKVSAVLPQTIEENTKVKGEVFTRNRHDNVGTIKMSERKKEIGDGEKPDDEGTKGIYQRQKASLDGKEERIDNETECYSPNEVKKRAVVEMIRVEAKHITVHETANMVAAELEEVVAENTEISFDQDEAKCTQVSGEIQTGKVSNHDKKSEVNEDSDESHKSEVINLQRRKRRPKHTMTAFAKSTLPKCHTARELSVLNHSTGKMLEVCLITVNESEELASQATEEIILDNREVPGTAFQDYKDIQIMMPVTDTNCDSSPLDFVYTGLEKVCSDGISLSGCQEETHEATEENEERQLVLESPTESFERTDLNSIDEQQNNINKVWSWDSLIGTDHVLENEGDRYQSTLVSKVPAMLQIHEDSRNISSEENSAYINDVKMEELERRPAMQDDNSITLYEITEYFMKCMSVVDLSQSEEDDGIEKADDVHFLESTLEEDEDEKQKFLHDRETSMDGTKAMDPRHFSVYEVENKDSNIVMDSATAAHNGNEEELVAEETVMMTVDEIKEEIGSAEETFQHTGKKRSDQSSATSETSCSGRTKQTGEMRYFSSSTELEDRDMKPEEPSDLHASATNFEETTLESDIFTEIQKNKGKQETEACSRKALLSRHRPCEEDKTVRADGVLKEKQEVKECFDECSNEDKYISCEKERYEREDCPIRRGFSEHLFLFRSPTFSHLTHIVAYPVSHVQLYKNAGWMVYESFRLDTFNDFPSFARASPIRMAQAGFFFTGVSDEVECYSCGVKYSRWSPKDIPLMVHRLKSPSCRYVNGIDPTNVTLTFKDIAPDSGAHAQLYIRKWVSRLLSGHNAIDSPGSSTPDSGSDTPDYGGQRSNAAPLATVTVADCPLTDPSTRVYTQPHAYKQYLVQTKRMASFNGWPEDKPQRPEVLVEAGFFFAGFSDCVRCFHCGLGLKNWDNDDDPWLEHVRWRSSCEHLIVARGRDYPAQAMRQIVEMERIADSDQEPQTSGYETAPQSDSYRSASNYDGPQTTSMKLREHQIPVQRPDIDGQETTSSTQSAAANTLSDNTVHVTSRQGSANNTAAWVESETRENRGNDNSRRLEDLRQENVELKEQSLCKQCKRKEVNMLFMPCGHLVVCENCSKPIKKCPLCKKKIQRKMKTFMS